MFSGTDLWVVLPIGALLVGRGLGFKDEPPIARWGILIPVGVFVGAAVLDVVWLAAAAAFAALGLQLLHVNWRQTHPEARWRLK